MFRRVLGRRKKRVEREASERDIGDRGEVAVGEAEESVTEEKVNELGAAVGERPLEEGRVGEARVLPDEAAEALSVSPSGLRRYAADYEAAFDELPRYEGRRVFSTEALERLRAAQALLRAKQAPSLKQALLRVKDEPGLVTAAGTAEAEGEASAPEDADMAGAISETEGPSMADAYGGAEAPAQQVGPSSETRLEPDDTGAKEVPAGSLQVTLHLTKGGWRLVAEGGAGEGERLLALLEPLVRAAGVARSDGSEGGCEGEVL